MPPLVPSLDDRDAAEKLDNLLSGNVNTDTFQCSLRKLHRRFKTYSDTCPAPFIAPGQIVTSEIRRQSEIYLPIAEISRLYNRFFSAALKYSPILASTPLHSAMSWADVFCGLPQMFQFSVNPAVLLEKLLENRQLLTQFICVSFLPHRFYGGFERYPQQNDFIRQWLSRQQKRGLRCLDAACGTGEDGYGLAKLLLERGFARDEFAIEGWTIEALEVWAAAYGRFPHDRQREKCFREKISGLFEKGGCSCIKFHCADLMNPPSAEPFDLILCNGLLGGPILNQQRDLERIAGNLARLLAPGGVLLVADSFHQGWKQKYPQRMLRVLFEGRGLETFDAGEGFGASRQAMGR